MVAAPVLAHNPGNWWQSPGLMGQLSYAGTYVGNDGLPFTADDVDISTATGAVALWSKQNYQGSSSGLSAGEGNPGGNFGGAIMRHSLAANTAPGGTPVLAEPLAGGHHFYPFVDNWEVIVPDAVGQRGHTDDEAESSYGQPHGGLWAEQEIGQNYVLIGNDPTDLNHNGVADAEPPEDVIHSLGSADLSIIDWPTWDAVNAGPYNNRRANQRGKGLPKFYMEISDVYPLASEHRRIVHNNGGIFNHMQGFTDGGLGGNSRRVAHVGSPGNPNPNADPDAQSANWQRGVRVPMSEIAGLADGDLGSNAFWAQKAPNHGMPTDAGFDLAKYLRDTIGPLLDPNGDGDPSDHVADLYGNLNDDNKFGLTIQDLDNTKHVSVVYRQAPVEMETDGVTNLGIAAVADMFGIDLADTVPTDATGEQTLTNVVVGTRILVGDVGIPLPGSGAAGAPGVGAVSFASPTCVDYNHVAFENMALIGNAGADMDGELGHGKGTLGNPWEKLDALAISPGTWDEFMVTLGGINGHETLDYLKWLQLGGASNCPGAATPTNGASRLGIDPERVWNTADGPAYAEVRARVTGVEAGQELHLVLSRASDPNDETQPSRPVAWAIIKDGVVPTLGVGGGAFRDSCHAVPTTGGVEVPSHDGSAQETFVDPSGSAAGLDTTWRSYVLCLDVQAKKLKIWQGETGGGGSLASCAGHSPLATFCFDGTGIDLSEIDGMRIYGEADPSDTEVEELNVDHIVWGYDFCADPSILYIWGQGANPNSNEFIFPQSAAASITCIPVTFNDAVTISNVCITSTGTPAATTATLGPDPARPGLGNYCLNLDAALEQQQWTTITMDVTGGCGQVVSVCLQVAHLPADVNQDGNVGLADASAFVSEFNGAKRPCLVDSNNDGQVGLADVSDWVNNFNGNAGIGIPQGNGTFLPAKPACACP
jgi:hypothetical protein